MPIDVTATMDISRRRPEVAAFLEDPANDVRWIRALSSSEKLTDGPVGKGTRVRRVAKMMGRPIDYTTEITAYDPGAKLALDTVSGPFPMHVTYTLTDAAGGTRVSVRNQGGTGWMFTLFSPLIGRMVNSRVKGDLRALRSALEKSR